MRAIEAIGAWQLILRKSDVFNDARLDFNDAHESVPAHPTVYEQTTVSISLLYIYVVNSFIEFEL